jgi:hypothetical protein
MARITVKTKKQLKDLFLRIKLRQDIPKILFYNPTIQTVYLEFGEVKGKTLLKYCKTKKLINISDSKCELTDIGKFAYLMNQFDISFIELCFLLETYICEKRMKAVCIDGFYVKYSFYEKVEDVISFGTLSNAITNLVRKNLIYRHHKASYSIIPKTFEELNKYQEIIERFHGWFIEIWRKKNEIILQDELVIKRQKDFSDIYQKIVFR